MKKGLTVFLVRHGESEWNLEGRLQGQTSNIPLTELGRSQALRAATQLANCNAQIVVSSDLLRAAETARIIAQNLSIPLRLENDLREQSLGIFEGRLVVEAHRETNDTDWLNPRWRPAGGESLEDVYTRLERLFRKLEEEYLGGQIIVVTHGDTARTALALLRGESLDGLAPAILKNGEFIKLASQEIT